MTAFEPRGIIRLSPAWWLQNVLRGRTVRGPLCARGKVHRADRDAEDRRGHDRLAVDMELQPQAHINPELLQEAAAERTADQLRLGEGLKKPAATDEHVTGRSTAAHTVALGVRYVLCTPLRVVRYLEHSTTDAEQRPIGVLYLDSREKGQLMSGGARSALEASQVKPPPRSKARACSRGDRKSAPRTGAAARRRNSARVASRGDAVGATLRRRRLIDSVPIDRRLFFRLLQSLGRSVRITLGDVAGKGPPAALLTAMIQGAFAAQVTSTDSPAALMVKVRSAMCRYDYRPISWFLLLV